MRRPGVLVVPLGPLGLARILLSSSRRRGRGQRSDDCVSTSRGPRLEYGTFWWPTAITWKRVVQVIGSRSSCSSFSAPHAGRLSDWERLLTAIRFPGWASSCSTESTNSGSHSAVPRGSSKWTEEVPVPEYIHVSTC